MKVDTRPRKRNAPGPPEKSARGYLRWLRGRPCVMAFNCDGPTEAAHVDHAGGKGMGTKVADRHALPLCRAHHAEQHRLGWSSFQGRYGNFDALAVAEEDDGAA